MSLFGGSEKKKIKKAEEMEKFAAAMAGLARLGGGLQAAGGTNPELGRSGAEMAGNTAAAAAEEKAAAQAKLEKRAGLLGTVGSVLPALIPEVGPLLSAGLSAAGGMAGYKLGGGQESVLERGLGYGMQQALPALMNAGVRAIAPGVGAEQLAKAGTGVGGTLATQAADMAGRGAGFVSPAQAAVQYPTAASIAAPGAVMTATQPRQGIGDRLTQALYNGFVGPNPAYGNGMYGFGVDPRNMDAGEYSGGMIGGLLQRRYRRNPQTGQVEPVPYNERPRYGF